MRETSVEKWDWRCYRFKDALCVFGFKTREKLRIKNRYTFIKSAFEACRHGIRPAPHRAASSRILRVKLLPRGKINKAKVDGVRDTDKLHECRVIPLRENLLAPQKKRRERGSEK